MSDPHYEIVLTPPARRAIATDLPEAVVAAAIDFSTTALLENPQRVGKPLCDDLEGIWSARRGTYRVLCRTREEPRGVIVLRIDHRRDVHRALT